MSITSDLFPQRPLKKNHTSLTGKIAGTNSNRLHSFESSLERDFVHLTNFNPNILEFVEQPVTIYGQDYNEDFIKYTPDYVVFYKNNDSEFPYIKPQLVEIKYRDELKNKWDILKPKFRAAISYCNSKNWKFKIITEVEIRTDYLSNAKFLKAYQNPDLINLKDVEILYAKLSTLNESTPKELLGQCVKSDKSKAFLLYTIWHMVSVYMIQADLTKKLSMNTPIWI